MNKALEISFDLLFEARENFINDMSPLKLQKLLYLTYEEYVRLYEEPLFNDSFEVWRHGPVNREVYDRFKIYASEVIDEEVNEMDINFEERMAIINTLNKYGDLSAWDLVDVTHDPSGLWYKKMENGETYINFEDVLKHVT